MVSPKSLATRWISFAASIHWSVAKRRKRAGGHCRRAIPSCRKSRLLPRPQRSEPEILGGQIPLIKSEFAIIFVAACVYRTCARGLISTHNLSFTCLMKAPSAQGGCICPCPPACTRVGFGERAGGEEAGEAPALPGHTPEYGGLDSVNQIPISYYFYSCLRIPGGR